MKTTKTIHETGIEAKVNQEQQEEKTTNIDERKIDLLDYIQIIQMFHMHTICVRYQILIWTEIL
mgnify:CR=1 FL=1